MNYFPWWISGGFQVHCSVYCSIPRINDQHPSRLHWALPVAIIAFNDDISTGPILILNLILD